MTSSQPQMYQPRAGFLLALIAFGAVAKLVPYLLAQPGIISIDPLTTNYPWGFSPMPAICLFGAAYFREVRWAFGVPLLAWLAGDVGILLVQGTQHGWSDGLGMGFYPGQLLVYAAFALIVAGGHVLRRNRSWWAIAGTGLAGAVVFYLVTNFGVWAFGEGIRYPLTRAGLVDCYVQAIPYFRNFVAGTLVFSAILFSRYGVRALQASDARRGAPAAEPVREHVRR